MIMPIESHAQGADIRRERGHHALSGSADTITAKGQLDLALVYNMVAGAAILAAWQNAVQRRAWPLWKTHTPLNALLTNGASLKFEVGLS